MKIAGRDAGKLCVVVDVLDDKTVLVDGETRRRKCNMMHLEPLNKIVKIAKGAEHAQVAKALGIEEKKPKKEKPAKKSA